jgi:Domain of unknown function (DUF4157)
MFILISNMRTHQQIQKKAQAQTNVLPIRSFSPPKPISSEVQPRSSHNLLDKPLFPTQAKLTNTSGAAKLFGQPNDKYEQEADLVAHQVVNQIHKQPIQRQEIAEEEELRMKPIVQRQSEASSITADSDLENAIRQSRSSGQPLTASIRQPMEQAFGSDFSGVKVHTDGRSDQMNRSIQARAFTTGQDIFFQRGAYDPNSRQGQELLAHELTHVMQQNGSAVNPPGIQRLVADQLFGTLYVPRTWLDTALEDRTDTLRDVSDPRNGDNQQLLNNLKSVAGIDIHTIEQVDPAAQMFAVLDKKERLPIGAYGEQNDSRRKWETGLQTALSMLNVVTILEDKNGKIGRLRQKLIINPEELVRAASDLASTFIITKACALIAIVKSEGANRTNLNAKLGRSTNLMDDKAYYEALHNHYYVTQHIEYDEPVTSPELYSEWGFSLIFAGKTHVRDLTNILLTTGKKYIFAIDGHGGHVVYVTMKKNLPTNGVPVGEKVADYFEFHSDSANYNWRDEGTHQVKYIFEK